MKEKNKIVIISISIIVLILISVFLITYNNNLIKLDYNELIEKIERKENFILCVSATECIHCQEYKPKLKKITKQYDIKIYYVNTDEFSEKEYDDFKEQISFDGATPVTIFFKDGEEKTTATRIEGNEKYEKIINKLKNNGFINK